MTVALRPPPEQPGPAAGRAERGSPAPEAGRCHADRIRAAANAAWTLVRIASHGSDADRAGRQGLMVGNVR